MKLNLHPKEFLALYNFLNSNLLTQTKVSSDEITLTEVTNRMRSYLMSILTKCDKTQPDDLLMERWEKDQKEKISNLELANKTIKKKFLTSDDEDFDNDFPLSDIKRSVTTSELRHDDWVSRPREKSFIDLGVIGDKSSENNFFMTPDPGSEPFIKKVSASSKK